MRRWHWAVKHSMLELLQPGMRDRQVKTVMWQKPQRRYWRPNAVAGESKSRTRAWSPLRSIQGRDMQTAIHHDAKFESHSFWYGQLVKLLQQRCHVVVSPPRNWSSLAARTLSLSNTTSPNAESCQQSSPRQPCLPQSLTSLSLPRDLPLASSPTPFLMQTVFRIFGLTTQRKINDREIHSPRIWAQSACSRYTKASTSEPTDISFCSPISIVSIESQPNSFSFSDSNVTDYCICNLFK